MFPPTRPATTGNPEYLSHPSVVNAAAKLECTKAQVFFRFVMDLGICPLTGTKNPTHMDQDLQVLDMKLPEEDFQNIRKAANL